MKRIPLNLGRWKATAPTRFAIVNDRDFAQVARFKWTAVKSGNFWYAQTMMKTPDGWRVVKMHRMIFGFPSVLIDHRNLNGLDNRRRNLRVATRSQNASNSAGHRDRKSKFKGVLFERFTGRWLAQLFVDGNYRFKARFDTEAQAGRAYKAAAKRYCGEFARATK